MGRKPLFFDRVRGPQNGRAEKGSCGSRSGSRRPVPQPRSSYFTDKEYLSRLRPEDESRRGIKLFFFVIDDRHIWTKMSMEEYILPRNQINSFRFFCQFVNEHISGEQVPRISVQDAQDIF